jgi:hypothetical protein
LQADISPCYVRPDQLVVLPQSLAKREEGLPDPLTVDSLLEKMLKESQALIMEVERPVIPVSQQQNTNIMFRTLAYAVQLELLNFAANYAAPHDKLQLILDSIWAMKPLKYSSTVLINTECKTLVQQILASLP